jgi:hypothetical protein
MEAFATRDVMIVTEQRVAVVAKAIEEDRNVQQENE